MASANIVKLKRKAAEFEQKKQFEKALTVYVQVLDEVGRDLEDADLPLFNRVGDLLIRQGDVSEALTYYEKAVDFYAERGFLNNAIALCNKILRQSPARSAVYYKLGKISASKGFKSDAKKNFLEYADRMQKSGQVDEAFRALKEFADLCPDQDDIRLMLADWLTKENRKSEALEQLETLYTKLEAEGRSAEARATIGRMQAIDPAVVPHVSGPHTTQKVKDLIFLDLADVETPTRRRERETPASPERAVAPPALGFGVAALEGLTLTFMPDEDNGSVTPIAVPIDGLERTSSDAPDDAIPAGPESSSVLDDIQRMPDVGDLAAIDSLLVAPADEWIADDDQVAGIEGLESTRLALSGSHPISPLDDPPLSGSEFSTLELDAEPHALAQPVHDLALPSDLPLLFLDDAGEVPADLSAIPLLGGVVGLDMQESLGSGAHGIGAQEIGASDNDTADFAAVDGSGRITEEILVVSDGYLETDEADDTGDEYSGDVEETPDSWVAAALSAKDDFSFDHLLTPLAIPVHRETPAASSLTPAQTEASGSPSEHEDASVNTDVKYHAPGEPYAPASEDSDDRPRKQSHDTGQDEVHNTASDEAHDHDRDAAHPDSDLTGHDGAHVEAYDDLTSLAGDGPADSGDGRNAGSSGATEAEIDLLDEMTAPFMRVRHDPASAGESPRDDEAESAALGLEVDELLAQATSGGAPRIPMLDLSTLHEQTRRPSPAPNDAAGTEGAELAFDDEQIKAAFSDPLVDLPLLDVVDLTPFFPGDDAATPSFGADTLADDFLSEPPAFGEGYAASDEFVPDPLLSPDMPSTGDWSNDVAPEVLIDGEWHDEHVGNLVTDESSTVTRDELEPPHDPPRFDDLAAAMLWQAPSDAEDDSLGSTPSPMGSAAYLLHMHSPGSVLSFGGLDAQLRRRLELDPENGNLRRQLGESLLDHGDREDGLNELELAMRSFERIGALDGARDVADVILRLVPLSVRHHQKRVEYAVRSNDRPRLIEAYVELADALFRSGEAEKAGVVYSRVLDLSPGNERAQLGLGLLEPQDDAASAAAARDLEDDAERGRTVDFGRPQLPGAEASQLHNSAEMPALDDLGLAVYRAAVVTGCFEAIEDDAAIAPSAPETVVEAPADEPSLSPLSVAENPPAVVEEAIIPDESAEGAIPGSAVDDVLPFPVGDESFTHSSVERADQTASVEEELSLSPLAQTPPPGSSEDALPPDSVQGALPNDEADESLAVASVDERHRAETEGAFVTPAMLEVLSSDAVAARIPTVGSPVTAVPASAHVDAQQAPGGDDELVDLGAWLRDDTPVRSTRMVTKDVPPSGDETADFNEMLKRFKQGLAENVDEEDYESHYDLGVAFKEMGLMDEAIAEFQKALRGDSHRVRSYEALGQCFVEKGQPQVAVSLLRRAAESTMADDQQLVGILYLLAYASETMERRNEALGYYQRVFAVDIEFRDVVQRVAALERLSQ